MEKVYYMQQMRNTRKSLRKYSKVTAEIVARKATKQQIVGKWRKINI